jgi:hypothetical protein
MHLGVTDTSLNTSTSTACSITRVDVAVAATSRRCWVESSDGHPLCVDEDELASPRQPPLFTPPDADPAHPPAFSHTKTPRPARHLTGRRGAIR